MTQNDADWEAAGAIRTALYRECPGIPSYPIGIVEPILTRHREASTAALMAEVERLRDGAVKAHNRAIHLAIQVVVEAGELLAANLAPSRPELARRFETLCDAMSVKIAEILPDSAATSAISTPDTIGGGEAATHPSLEMCVQWSDDGRHIRKWSRFPFEGGECLYSHPATPQPVSGDAADMAAFGASEAAAIYYPGADQQVERLAFCAGAAHAVTTEPSGDAVREALEEAFSKGAEWQKDGCDPYRIAVNSTCDAIIAALAALNGGTQG